jgi:hypothetical protein
MGSSCWGRVCVRVGAGGWVGMAYAIQAPVQNLDCWALLHWWGDAAAAYLCKSVYMTCVFDHVCGLQAKPT